MLKIDPKKYTFIDELLFCIVQRFVEGTVSGRVLITEEDPRTTNRNINSKECLDLDMTSLPILELYLK